MKGLIGKKVGMTQLIADDGRVTPVTIIEAGPCFVTQVRTPEKEGYHSVQLGFEEVHRLGWRNLAVETAVGVSVGLIDGFDDFFQLRG